MPVSDAVGATVLFTVDPATELTTPTWPVGKPDKATDMPTPGSALAGTPVIAPGVTPVFPVMKTWVWGGVLYSVREAVPVFVANWDRSTADPEIDLIVVPWGKPGAVTVWPTARLVVGVTLEIKRDSAVRKPVTPVIGGL